MSGLEVTMMKRIGELNEEVKLLKAEVERLQHLANQSEFYRSQLQKDTCRLENIQMQDAFKHYEAENARLKAEVERLTKAHSDALADFWAIHKGYFDLKAEVERLRKAGDAMASSIQFNEEMAKDYNGPTIVRQCVKEWLAATEGRPNE